jgi:hypothetical protein
MDLIKCSGQEFNKEWFFIKTNDGAEILIHKEELEELQILINAELQFNEE